MADILSNRVSVDVIKFLPINGCTDNDFHE